MYVLQDSYTITVNDVITLDTPDNSVLIFDSSDEYYIDVNLGGTLYHRVYSRVVGDRQIIYMRISTTNTGYKAIEILCAGLSSHAMSNDVSLVFPPYSSITINTDTAGVKVAKYA